jgi:2-amino-4-hydroxy-6-hydroxymethyldihydropteridine diphosphokinase
VILIALGANLPSPAGAPAETLNQAVNLMAQRSITVERQSGFYRSAAWPNPADPPFLNAMVSVKTTLSPVELLSALHRIEAHFGRMRGEPNAPRTLDLDLIDYEGRVEPGPPELPHPRMHLRAFVLCPLAEIAPDWRHPVTGLTVRELIDALPPSDIRRYGFHQEGEI